MSLRPPLAPPWKIDQSLSDRPVVYAACMTGVAAFGPDPREGEPHFGARFAPSPDPVIRQALADLTVRIPDFLNQLKRSTRLLEAIYLEMAQGGDEKSPVMFRLYALIEENNKVLDRKGLIPKVPL